MKPRIILKTSLGNFVCMNQKHVPNASKYPVRLLTEANSISIEPTSWEITDHKKPRMNQKEATINPLTIYSKP